ncbi:Uroporphyrinogen decarboxylase [Acididesulfobacillus acetoxydans]|uniref:Uroporphyrinogen decarboxylase n=1 Tax=Acididesulfobacillus acetoxydans TaxID=1561005 RepID=A0A8S0WN06_9FIRM|nr:uroporphyrinogen decarboxylase family protein [Acididesulfobacillus acetoxydans]CAA7600914.1 Uroporphyrinogen decarboxylase [Acididesulfobacillus acetoxydans]CEJ08929.1 Uroporphyrinogen-III decarboxylase-like protein [Acididesulfobacillus acetoxydans]
MNSRERVLAAINHKEPDRVPLYFGGTSSFMTDEAYFQLKDYLGITGDVEAYREGHTGNYFDQRILEALDADVRFVHMKKAAATPVRRIDENTVLCDWGVPIRKIDGYGVRVDPPLAHATKSDIACHPWPDPYDPGRTAGLALAARTLREQTDKAVVARSPQSASFLEYGAWLRGMEQFLMDLLLDRGFAEALLDKILDLQIGFYDALLTEVGRYVDIVETAEDYGTQNGLLISPQLFRDIIKPRRKAINDFIRKKAPGAKILHHSCGAIEPIITDLVEVGVDILNPVQPLPNMNPSEIKKKYGDKVVLCGGVDMQNTGLQDPYLLEQEVVLRIEQLASGGGYLFAPSNHIQPDLPTRSVVALFALAKKHGVYGRNEA